MKAVFGTHGHMSHSEAEKGLTLLKKIMKEKEANAHEVTYTHMPECVQAPGPQRESTPLHPRLP